MKTIALILIMAAGGLAGCAVGAANPRVVIETAEPRLGDSGYARAMALRQNQVYRARIPVAEISTEKFQR
jgi:hypothetical protein